MRFDQTVRNINMTVELYQDSTLIKTIDNELISLNVSRAGDESKIFGYGICQKLNVKFLNSAQNISVSTKNNLKINTGKGSDRFFPSFYVTEVNVDEVTNVVSVTAYDKLYNTHTASEIALPSYTVKQYAQACSDLIGAKSLLIKGVAPTETCFDTSYPEGANIEGTESVRELLDAIAEVTQTVYFIDKQDNLVFKRLEKDTSATFTINKDKYFSLKSKTNRRLTELCSVTELGDNVSVKLAESGTTQYIRNNPFWELRTDLDVLLNNALSVVGGLTINQFECEWQGDLNVEIGDKIALTTKDNKTVISYLLNDTVDFNGSLCQKTSWTYNDNEEETASNPSDLGEALKQTFAKVDKANKKINLMASEVAEDREQISELEINTQNITASVSELRKSVDESVEGVHDSISHLKDEVNASISSNNARIDVVQKEIEDGVEKVKTSTGFTFDQSGLTVDKQGTEMSTKITEDGMQVLKNNETVLTANNQGVDAQNLHAVTYLIIGNNSRLEDYVNKDGETRTACFWIQDIK